MSDWTPSSVPENALFHSAPSLSPQAIDQVLADFRTWLEELARHEGPETGEDTDRSPAADVDLATVVGQFVALRQEVNLQTRASRNQLEQNAQTLQELTRTINALEKNNVQTQGFDQQSQEEKLRPLIKTLIEANDALALARREVSRIQETLLSQLERYQAIPPLPDFVASSLPQFPGKIRLPWWARLLGVERKIPRVLASLHSWWKQELNLFTDRKQALLQYQEHIRNQGETVGKRLRQAVQSILTGYAMSLHRIERTLQQFELEPIPALGQPFDPERMEVLEAVTDSGRPAGEVVDEIRRGYFWRGRIFRFAQVRVARNE